MIQIIQMAFRDLMRNRRRSFFSALALGIGLALLMLMAGVIAGEYGDAMDKAIALQTGHLQVLAQSYNQSKASLAWGDLIENPDAMAAQIATLPQVKAATPRLLASGIVSSGVNTVGVRAIGIDPASAANAPFRDGLVGGSFLTADDRAGILVGQALADKLKIKAGDTVNLLLNTSNGNVDQQAFTVRGVYSTKTPGIDQSTIFLPIAKEQAITQTQNHASNIFILLKDRDQTAAVAGAIPTSQYQVKTYIQMNDMVVQTEQFASSYMVVLYLIILAITATVIINTLIMSVFERTREIGILSAIGMKASRIMAMFFTESGMLAVGGILIGLILGGLLVWYASTTGFFVGNIGVTGILIGETLYARFNPSDAVTLVIAAFIVSMLAALYPAILAARMEPVQALRAGN
jgi:ABC-type lipoprotein release transport system permease subunit